MAETAVPFVDLAKQHEPLGPELRAAIERVISRGEFILGPAVEAFERQFATYVGTRHCVGLNSGTSALHLALRVCDVGPGDEVITTPLTWISTSWAISYVGAKPVFVDIDPETLNIDPRQVRRAVTPRTKAILPVHLYGRSCDMDGLLAIAAEHGLTLIEDAAQAHGASWRGRRLGSLGRIGCYSFYPAKNLGAFGEGGAVVTDDAALAERIRQLRDHAQCGRHVHAELGYNARMEGIQGAVLGVKLAHLDRWNAARARLAEGYRRLLDGVPGIQLPPPAASGQHVWHLYVVLVQGQPREAFQQALAARGIATAVHYPTLVPFQPAYADLGHRRGDLPVAENAARCCLSLPMFPDMTEEQLHRVADAVRALS